MGITRISLTLSLLIVLAISMSYNNVSAVSVIEPAKLPTRCFHQCGGIYDDHACFTDCIPKGYDHGMCRNGRCCCFNDN
ncbi:hypothetical protein YC2023_091187 [Brassica napus]